MRCVENTYYYRVNKLDTSKNRFSVGLFSMITADDAFYGGLVSIISAKLGGVLPLAPPPAYAAAYFPDSQTKRRMSYARFAITIFTFARAIPIVRTTSPMGPF